MSAIHLRQLVKKFDAFTAVKSMDLEIADGEFLALLGPSGCGKSTTMNMIAGLEDITSGSIWFGDRDMSAVPLAERGVGFVFQDYAIFTHMTVRQNLAYGLKVRKIATADVNKRVEEMAAFLQLSEFLDRKTNGLSVNILQRVAIGRSAMLKPAIFLLDEPLSNVDAAFRAVMRTELKQLQRQLKQTMVYVTHDQLEAMTMADRIAVMDHGVLQQVGTPLDIYNNPANTFVAGFIGSPGMNLIRGYPVKSDRGLRIDLGAMGLSPPVEKSTADILLPDIEDVWYGFRPENIELTTPGQGFSLPVNLTERIGARTIVHLGADSDVKAVFENDVALNIGQQLAFKVPSQHVRLFDGRTGSRLGQEAPRG
jgi:multiple sugar transport system ATP-binding protein